MKTLILGAGEVGKSLSDVLSRSHEVSLMDTSPVDLAGVDVLNICFPCVDPDVFIASVVAYVERYKPLVVTIIHSTVPVTTTRRINEMLSSTRVVHSPIHGVHPNLADGIMTFPKYVGGSDPDAAAAAIQFLREAGIETQMVASSEASELSKLLCTTYYAWNVLFAKEAKALCDQHNVPFDEVYTKWNGHYNQGYKTLGKPNVARPVLKPTNGPIGGHCLIPNAELLEGFWIADTIIKRNGSY